MLKMAASHKVCVKWCPLVAGGGLHAGENQFKSGFSFLQTQTVIHTVQNTPGQLFPVSLKALVGSQPHHVPLPQGLNSVVPETGRKQCSKEDGGVWGWALCSKDM